MDDQTNVERFAALPAVKVSAAALPIDKARAVFGWRIPWPVVFDV